MRRNFIAIARALMTLAILLLPGCASGRKDTVPSVETSPQNRSGAVTGPVEGDGSRTGRNARALPATVEGYSPTVLPTGPISLGRAAFQRGANQIAVEIVGKDPRSQGYSEGYLVGVDGFLLRR